MANFALPLREEDVDPDPLLQFAAWYKDASQAGLREPGAMALATSTAEGVPSVRMVLLKGYDERGFVFYTNYSSRKGLELEANPRAALLFYWDPLGRQVRIEGHTERTSPQRVCVLRSQPATGQPAERTGVATEPSHRESQRARTPRRPPHSVVYGYRSPRPRYMGRVPPVARQLRVLATPRGQASRPLAIYRRRRRSLAAEAARPVAEARLFCRLKL